MRHWKTIVVGRNHLEPVGCVEAYCYAREGTSTSFVIVNRHSTCNLQLPVSTDI